ncbi:MAG: glycosyltransferase family 9 protein [candidate division Zixibacteria bacterium]|nr:glycosyltransferase family 9 protein [candidate division Zixibacteria bacterium]
MIRFSSLGDVVLASAVLRALSQAYPDARLTFATKTVYQPLFENFGTPVTVIPYDPDQGFLSLRRELSRVRYDHIIDLHGSIRSVMLSRTLRAGNCARVHKHVAKRRAMVRSKQGLETPLSALGTYMETLKSLGVNVATPYPVFSLSSDEMDRVRKYQQESPSCIGVGWGAHWPTKQVPSAIWEGLLQRLSNASPLQVRLFGMDTDRGAMEAFVEVARGNRPETRFQIECGHSLREVMVKLATCTVFVGSDSGLMHLAAAMGVPSIGLFGPTHPSLGFAPVGPGARAFHAGTYCSPCHRHGAAACTRERRFCFDELNLEQIATAIDTILSSKSGPENRGLRG